MDNNIQTRLDSIMNTEPEIGLNQTTIYSDVGLIVLGKVIESVSKNSLEDFVASVIFEPLGLKSSFYNPPNEKNKRVIPTEFSELYGDFDDYTAFDAGIAYLLNKTMQFDFSFGKSMSSDNSNFIELGFSCRIPK